MDQILEIIEREIKKEPVDEGFNPIIIKSEPLDESEVEEQQNISEITSVYKSAPKTNNKDPRGKFSPQISNPAINNYLQKTPRQEAPAINHYLQKTPQQEAPAINHYLKKNLPQQEELFANLSEARSSQLRRYENGSVDHKSKRRRGTNSQEDVEMRAPPERAPINSKSTKNAGVQTTNNDGYFSIILDLKKLSNDERQALKVFKKAMGYEDDSSTAGILERLEHRRANLASDRNPEVNSSPMPMPPSAPKFDIQPNKSYSNFVLK